jgi:hypothetical protein
VVSRSQEGVEKEVTEGKGLTHRTINRFGGRTAVEGHRRQLE